MTSQAIQNVVVHVTKMITGIKKRFPNGSQVLTFGGSSQTVDQVTSAMQAFVDHRTATDTARAAAQVAFDAETAAAPPLLAMIAAFTKFVRSTFGTTADALADFDLDPPKTPAPRTAEQKAVAAAKAVATRKARGTTSAKQKKSVKGNVTATLVVTPATPAPAAPVTEAVPAPASPAPATK
jgi:hypothetical protein